MRLIVSIPCYREQMSAHLGSDLFYCGVVAASRGIEMGIDWISTCDVDYSHNVLLWRAMFGMKADWCLIVGSDQWPNNREWILDIARMVTKASEPNYEAAIIGAPVLMSSQSGYNVQIKAGENIGFDLTEQPDVFPVEQIGSGCCAYNLHWFRKFWSKAPWFDSPCKDNGNQAPPSRFGVDYYICQGVRARGGKIYCDKRFTMSHKGTDIQTDPFGGFILDEKGQPKYIYETAHNEAKAIVHAQAHFSNQLHKTG